MGRKRTGIEFTCPVCGKSVHRPASFLKKAKAETCSRACRAVLQKTGAQKTCQVCGKTFYLTKRRASNDPGLYCSKICNGLAIRNRGTVECAWCKKTLERPQYKIESLKRHFCDLTCTHEWKARFGTKKGRGAFTMKQKREWMDTKCKSCGSTEDLELDHITPRFAGGSNTKDNAQTLCRTCNREKYWLSDQFKFSYDLPCSR